MNNSYKATYSPALVLQQLKRARRIPLNISVDEGTLQRLRELRLWHWEQSQMHRKLEEWYRARNPQRAKKDCIATERHRIMADQHIKFVQTLNDFFEAGDTAERDAAQ